MIFEREDWTFFRNIETLPQKAGVSRDKIPALVAKELIDNALDTSSHCEINPIPGGFIIKDNGPGIPLEAIEDIFSINRPMLSSKLIRLPRRGALGNGLRVVSGSVLYATGGNIQITTQGKVMELQPGEEGRTKVEITGETEQAGTEIKVIFGSGIENTDLQWAKDAIAFSSGEEYKGKTSPFWYTSEAFYELTQAHGGYIRELITEFEGCTGTKAGRILNLSGLKNKQSRELTFELAEELLRLLRKHSKPVISKRLGSSEVEFKDFSKVKAEGVFPFPSAKGNLSAEIPFVIQAWAKSKDIVNNQVDCYVNKTPVTGECFINTYKAGSKTFYLLEGNGLNLEVKKTKEPVFILINVITPYMPITTDGKEPDFSYMQNEIKSAVEKAIRKSKVIVNSSGGRTQKSIVYSCISEAVEKASGDGKYRFSQRQLFYIIRPFLIDEIGREPEYDTFTDILNGYENEYGLIPGMYRDPRGVLYHPHTKESIPLGTIAVEKYKRPEWTFNKILYCEKEGFISILCEAGWPERNDCALVTSKGQASRAVKDLFDLLGETEEELLFFCIHDSDAAGTVIYDSLQNETKSRPGRKVRVINLGLDPWEAEEMDLPVEKVDRKARQPVGSYIKSLYGGYYEDWLQSNRVELNAMTTPEFMNWLDDKMSLCGNGKILPPPDVAEEELTGELERQVEEMLKEKILKENHFKDKVTEEMKILSPAYSQKGNYFVRVIDRVYSKETAIFWKEIMKEAAGDIIAEDVIKAA